MYEGGKSGNAIDFDGQSYKNKIEIIPSAAGIAVVNLCESQVNKQLSCRT